MTDEGEIQQECCCVSECHCDMGLRWWVPVDGSFV